MIWLIYLTKLAALGAVGSAVGSRRTVRFKDANFHLIWTAGLEVIGICVCVTKIYSKHSLRPIILSFLSQRPRQQQPCHQLNPLHPTSNSIIMPPHKAKASGRQWNISCNRAIIITAIPSIINFLMPMFIPLLAIRPMSSIWLLLTPILQLLNHHLPSIISQKQLLPIQPTNQNDHGANKAGYYEMQPSKTLQLMEWFVLPAPSVALQTMSIQILSIMQDSNVYGAAYKPCSWDAFRHMHCTSPVMKPSRVFVPPINIDRAIRSSTRIM